MAKPLLLAARGFDFVFAGRAFWKIISSMMNIQNLPLEKLEPNPLQYRREITEADVRDLADSIAEAGVLQPILARPHPKKKSGFQIIAGERRWRASKLANQKTIPAIVRAMNDIEALSIALIENTQRDDPDDWATAQGIKQLMDLHAQSGAPLSERAVAKMLKKSVSYVRNHLGLFKLRPALQKVAQKHANVKSSLFEIEKVHDTQTEAELLEAVENGASFSQIKARVIEHLESEKQKKESFRVPDKETAQRAAEYFRSGSAPVSRGRQLKGNTSKEAFEAVTQSLTDIERKLGTIAHWEPLLTESQRARIMPHLREIELKMRRLKPT